MLPELVPAHQMGKASGWFGVQVRSTFPAALLLDWFNDLFSVQGMLGSLIGMAVFGLVCPISPF